MDSATPVYDQCMQRTPLAKAGREQLGPDVKVLVKTDSLAKTHMPRFNNGWLEQKESNGDAFSLSRSPSKNLKMTKRVEFQGTDGKDLVGWIDGPLRVNVAFDSKTQTALQFGEHKRKNARNWQVELTDEYRFVDGLKEKGAPLRLYLMHASGEIGHFVMLSEAQEELWTAAITKFSPQNDGGVGQKEHVIPQNKPNRRNSFTGPSNRDAAGGHTRRASLGSTAKHQTPVVPLDSKSNGKRPGGHGSPLKRPPLKSKKPGPVLVKRAGSGAKPRQAKSGPKGSNTNATGPEKAPKKPLPLPKGLRKAPKAVKMAKGFKPEDRKITRRNSVDSTKETQANEVSGRRGSFGSGDKGSSDLAPLKKQPKKGKSPKVASKRPSGRRSPQTGSPLKGKSPGRVPVKGTDRGSSPGAKPGTGDGGGNPPPAGSAGLGTLAAVVFVLGVLGVGLRTGHLGRFGSWMQSQFQKVKALRG